MLVTHALDQVAELCDRAIVLEEGRIQLDGEPRDALRHLRADFELARQEERERERERAADRVQVRASRARVLSVDVLDAGGGALMATKPGEDVVVRVRIEAVDEISDWILGVGIDSQLGQVVYGTNTRLLGIPMPTFRGERVFEVRLPRLWLGEGQYSVHGAIAEPSGVEIDRLPDAATFSVESDGQSIGYIHTQPEVRFG